MQKRRDFIKTTLVMAAGAAIGSSSAASAKNKLKFTGIIYTADDPGKWDKKVGSHAPKVAVKGQNVTITTKHGMTEQHYIVRHTLVSEKGEVLGEKTFYPTDKKAISTFTLPEKNNSKLYATSFCNKHDLWITEFSV